MRRASSREIALATALLVLTAYGALLLALMRHRRDISWFVVAGGPAVDVRNIPPGLSIIPNIGGYDGMWFYRLALDPFTRQQTAFGITLDNPPYRQQRILYPLIVHVLSGGVAAAVPTLLVIVNLAAIVVMTLGASAIARQHGLGGWWGALLPLYPGFLIAFSRGTGEMVAWAFAVLAIHAAGGQHWPRTAVLFAMAALTRETTLVCVAALGVVALSESIRARKLRRDVAWLAIPAVTYATWQIVLWRWWGTSGLGAGDVPNAPPFSSFLGMLASASARTTVSMRLHFAEAVFWILVVICTGAVIARRREPLAWPVAWVVYLWLAATLGRDQWAEQAGFMRILGDLFATSGIILFRGGRAVRWIVLVVTCLLSLYVATHLT